MRNEWRFARSIIDLFISEGKKHVKSCFKGRKSDAGLQKEIVSGINGRKADLSEMRRGDTPVFFKNPAEIGGIFNTYLQRYAFYGFV